jgi:hypothetical protein
VPERPLQHLRFHVSAKDGVEALEGGHQHLAAHLGLTGEPLYRALASLEAACAIARTGQGIVLKKPWPA